MDLVLRIVLGLCSLGIMALGLDVALGGIGTLGWQGPTDFFSVTDPERFAIQDNHVRFIAGIWFGVGVMFLAGAWALQRMRSILIMLIILIFMGGLARLSAGDMALVTSVDILPSLFAELVLFPLIGFWIYRHGNHGNG